MKVGVKIVRWMLTSSLNSFTKHLNENSKLKITHPQLGSLALNEKNSPGSFSLLSALKLMIYELVRRTQFLAYFTW